MSGIQRIKLAAAAARKRRMKLMDAPSPKSPLRERKVPERMGHSTQDTGLPPSVAGAKRSVAKRQLAKRKKSKLPPSMRGKVKR